MTALAMVIHSIVSILLVVVILMQSGRGGGLTEGFASAESMLGAKTNSFMVKTTTVLCTLFLITCLTIAVLSAKKERSLMADINASVPASSGETATESQPAVTETIEIPAMSVTENAEAQAQ